MDVLSYIVDDALIVIPVLNAIGYILKPRLCEDWTIPFILLPIGIILCLFIMPDFVDGIIQGVLTTGASVFVHQLVSQYKKQY